MHIQDVIANLKLLADGKELRYGNPAPPDSPCEHPDAIRSLYIAISIVERHARNKRLKHETPNLGERWTEDEERCLVAEFRSGKSVQALAEAHKRTPGGVRIRLIRLGLIKERNPYQKYMRRWFGNREKEYARALDGSSARFAKRQS